MGESSEAVELDLRLRRYKVELDSLIDEQSGLASSLDRNIPKDAGDRQKVVSENWGKLEALQHAQRKFYDIFPEAQYSDFK